MLSVRMAGTLNMEGGLNKPVTDAMTGISAGLSLALLHQL